MFSRPVQTFADIYRYRFILATLVAKDLKAQYRSMALGFLWSLLNPLVMVAVLSVVLVWFLGGGPDTPSLVVVGLIWGCWCSVPCSSNGRSSSC
jgi:ABC-type polysaccharide/polyol phosphate export permease